MANILSKNLRSAFVAGTLLFSGAAAYADEGPVKDEAEKTCTTEKKDDKKSLYEMNFEELLKKENGDYEDAWETYEFYQLRRIELDGAVKKETVDKLITEIEILDSLAPGEPITLMIDSGGGSVYDGLRLYNAMKSSKSPVHTFVNGRAASMAAIILIAGDVRMATAESRVLIHQVAGGTRGKVENMEHDINHASTLQDDLFEIIAENTGLSLQDIRRIAANDVYYDGEESIQLGFVDKLTASKPSRDIKPGSRDVPEKLYPENRVREYYEKLSQSTPSRP